MTWYTGRNQEVTVHQGRDAYPLPHKVRHSPDGFSWGYHGSGPAELARCLLIHALGTEAECPVCGGTGQIVYVYGEEMSVARAEAEAEGFDWAEHVYGCNRCEDGLTIDSPMYQAFKSEVIANIPQDDAWAIDQADVVEWYRAYTMQDVTT